MANWLFSKFLPLIWNFDIKIIAMKDRGSLSSPESLVEFVGVNEQKT
jgi:hypothetical protein